jgi:ligand-binding sensor domain-containing protein
MFKSQGMGQLVKKKLLQNLYTGYNPEAGIVRMILLFGWFLLYIQTIHASKHDFYDNMRYSRLSINDGLSQNLVSSIHQDKMGFMWMGTKDGLNMYDGYTFKKFKHNPADPSSISDNFIEVIFCDRQGRIWLGTNTGGLNLYDRAQNSFIRFLNDPANEKTISSNSILSITDDIHGNIWVGTSGGGVNRISIAGSELIPHIKDVTITRFAGHPVNKALGKHKITSLFTDSNHLLWIGTHKGVYTLHIESLLFQQIPLRSMAPVKSPLRFFADGQVIIFEDHKGGIWMFARAGLFKYDADLGVFLQDEYDYHLDRLQNTSYNPLAASVIQVKEEYGLWLSSEKGLTVYFPEKGIYHELPQNNDNPEGLPEGHLISVFADRSGTIWIGSNGYGLASYDPYAIKFNYPLDSGINSNGEKITSRDLSVRAIYQNADGLLWIGANQGFFSVNRFTSEIKQRVIEAPGITEKVSVYSIQADQGGILWLGSSAGLVRFDPVKLSYDIFCAWHSDQSESDDPRVATVFFQDEQVWVLTPYSMARFDQEAETFRHVRFSEKPLDRYREMVFPVVFKDKKGNIWLGSHEGFHGFDKEKNEFVHFINDPGNAQSLPFNNVRTILPDHTHPDKYLWVATGGGGLAKFDMDSYSFTVWNEKDGLSNNLIYGMLEDQNQNLWLSTNHGLSRFDVGQKQFHNYTIADGLQSNEFNSGAYFINSRGEIFFGGIMGYNCFFPEQVKHKNYQPRVVFTDFQLLKRENPDNEIIRNIAETETISLEHYQNDFSIEFAALDLGSPRRNRFAISLSFFVSSSDNSF